MEKHYLAVPFNEKDWAKSLGARWDPQAMLWFATGDLGRFARWAPGLAAKRRKGNDAEHARKRQAYQERMRQGFYTPRTDESLPDCGCQHMAPWSECEHSEIGLDAASAQHMREISRA